MLEEKAGFHLNASFRKPSKRKYSFATRILRAGTLRLAYKNIAIFQVDRFEGNRGFVWTAAAGTRFRLASQFQMLGSHQSFQFGDPFQGVLRSSRLVNLSHSIRVDHATPKVLENLGM